MLGAGWLGVGQSPKRPSPRGSLSTGQVHGPEGCWIRPSIHPHIPCHLHCYRPHICSRRPPSKLKFSNKH